MTAMLLAIALSDAALNAAEMRDYRAVEPQEIGGHAEPHVVTPSTTRAWTPRIDSWNDEQADCPIFFRKEIEGFGTFKVGPRCQSEPQR